MKFWIVTVWYNFQMNEGLSTVLALDPHETSCFGQRSQRLIQLIGTIMTKDFVVHFESLVELFGLVL